VPVTSTPDFYVRLLTAQKFAVKYLIQILGIGLDDRFSGYGAR